MALNRLYTKLHYMYDAIEKATEASINPVPKNGKIETRIRNFESKINMKRNLEEIFFIM